MGRAIRELKVLAGGVVCGAIFMVIALLILRAFALG